MLLAFWPTWHCHGWINAEAPLQACVHTCASRHVSGVLVNPVIKSNALSMHWHHYWYNINICHDQDNVMYNDIVIHDIAIVHVSAKLTSLIMSFNLY